MLEKLIELIKNARENCNKADCGNCGLAKFGGFPDCKDKRIAHYLLDNNVIILPCTIDTKVWVLGQPCGGCSCYNEPMKEEFIEICRNCDLWEIGECKFDYELIPEFGKLVFLTKEEAEKVLKEKLDNAKNIELPDKPEQLKDGAK